MCTLLKIKDMYKYTTQYVYFHKTNCFFKSRLYITQPNVKNKTLYHCDIVLKYSKL